MKKIQNWQKFNELDSSTYYRAARKLKDIGHIERANRLDQHSTDMDMRGMDAIKDKNFPGVEPFNFIVPSESLKLKGELGFIESGMAWDTWLDSEKEWLSIAPYFKMTGFDRFGYDDGKSFYMSPFWAEYKDGKISYVFSIDSEESPWNIREGDPVYFSTRRDAVRFLKILKDYDIGKSVKNYAKTKEEKADAEEFIGLWNEAVSNIKINEIFR